MQVISTVSGHQAGFSMLDSLMESLKNSGNHIAEEPCEAGISTMFLRGDRDELKIALAQM
jgi:hypothetical protein